MVDLKETKKKKKIRRQRKYYKEKNRKAAHGPLLRNETLLLRGTARQ